MISKLNKGMQTVTFCAKKLRKKRQLATQLMPTLALKGKSMPDIESQHVAVARISMLQAVLVAVVTAIGGFSTAYLSNAGAKSASTLAEINIQRWISIEKITLQNPTSIDLNKFRSSVEANSISYSFPSNSVWASIGPDMNGERFPLPIGTDTYSFRFYATGRIGAADYLGFKSRSVINISTVQLPMNNQSIELRPTSLFTNETVNVPKVTIFYSIE
jgi:hypothetical protein